MSKTEFFESNGGLGQPQGRQTAGFLGCDLIQGGKKNTAQIKIPVRSHGCSLEKYVLTQTPGKWLIPHSQRSIERRSTILPVFCQGLFDFGLKPLTFLGRGVVGNCQILFR